MHFLRSGFKFPVPLDLALVKSLGVLGKPAALKKLWPLLARDRGQKLEGKHYSLDPAFAAAYAAYYLPANAMKMTLILEEMRVAGLEINQQLKWLDVGSGPGTAFWGAAWWASERQTEVNFLGLEQSREFLQLATTGARTLISELNSKKINARFESFTHGAGSRSLVQWIRQERPQVLSMMNSVAEMVPSLAERKVWLNEVMNELANGANADGKPRWLILIEPGSKIATRELIELKEDLGRRPDVRIWLPCLSARPCGALARPDDWCHEQTEVQFPEWLNKLGAEAGLRKEAVLFSYLVCSVGKHPPALNSWPTSGQRVVSQLMHEKGLDQCFLCTENGKVRARVLHSRVTDENRSFKNTARGCVYESVELSDKGDVVAFKEVPWACEADPTVLPPLE